ncbi:MAG: glycosyltransferase family 4 protein [Nitrospinae bacterium]|nr:glycosyltransferase family 4 protein [Nitrospinota bacterium]
MPVPKNDPVFLLICRLVKDKGVVEYVEAARIIKSRYPKVTFNLLGPLDVNNPSAISKSQIEKWHQEGVIHYCGETEDVRPFLYAASVFVLPSYYEGTPHSTLEAMATGLPILTTDVAGCRETVIHGKNGFLVPLRDENALVKAMERFILDPDLISKMGETSREIVVNKYDIHQVNARIIAVMGLEKEKTPRYSSQQ